ncbi:hypothetical protein UlMin_025704 [Ulmus minor]
MADPMDLSLDDLIQNNKKSNSSNGDFRFGGQEGGSGPDRRFWRPQPVRSTPYPSVPYPMLQQEMAMSKWFEAGEFKLYISNLDYDVSNQDIQLLFSAVGELKQYSLHYDESGIPMGTAEVVFLRYSDALAAIKRYNNVKLDGKPMNIELMGVDSVDGPIFPPTTAGILGTPNSSFRSGQGRPGFQGTGGCGFGHGKPGFRGNDGSGFGHGRPGFHGNSGPGFGHERPLFHGNDSGGFGRGRTNFGWGRNHDNKVTAEDLDADLEKYRREARKQKLK